MKCKWGCSESIPYGFLPPPSDCAVEFMELFIVIQLSLFEFYSQQLSNLPSFLLCIFQRERHGAQFTSNELTKDNIEIVKPSNTYVLFPPRLSSCTTLSFTGAFYRMAPYCEMITKETWFKENVRGLKLWLQISLLLNASVYGGTWPVIYLLCSFFVLPTSLENKGFAQGYHRIQITVEWINVSYHNHRRFG